MHPPQLPSSDPPTPSPSAHRAPSCVQSVHALRVPNMEAISSTKRDDRVPNDMERLKHASLPTTDSETGVKLFGVRIANGSTALMMRKAVSMVNLSSYNSTCSPRAVSLRCSTSEQSESGEVPGTVDPHGYVSDGLIHNSGVLREKKKGVPWTEEEHRMFLMGLEKLGKGDWRGIARAFVPTRTPTQVASHAQKYFLRQNNLSKRKRRSSLFDMITSTPASTVCHSADHSGSCSTELNLASSASVSADLCLGRPDEAHYEQQQSQVQRWCHKFSSQSQTPGFLGTRATVESPKPLWLPTTLSSQGFFSESNAKKPRLAGMANSFPSSSPISSSASSSSLSSLCRIDEDTDLATGLTLGIGQPHLLEPAAELSLKLEQPSCEGSGNNSSTCMSAIRVV